MSAVKGKNMFNSINLLCVIIISPMVAYLLGALVFSLFECECAKSQQNNN